MTANLLKVMSKSVITWKAAQNMFEKAQNRGSGAVDLRTSRGAVSPAGSPGVPAVWRLLL